MMTTKHTASTTPGQPLTDEEKDKFDRVLALLSTDSDDLLAVGMRLALARTSLDGRSVAAIVVVAEQEEDAVEIHPLALLVDDAMFDRLEQP